jgi:hypothetical protein
MPVLNPPAVQGFKGGSFEFLARLAKGTLGDLTHKTTALVQVAKEGVKRTLQGYPTTQLEQETDDDWEGKATLAGEVTRARSMSLAKGLRAEGYS